MSAKKGKIEQLAKKSCDRVNSFMTPCFVRDGDSALDDDGFCIGCGIHKFNMKLTTKENK